MKTNKILLKDRDDNIRNWDYLILFKKDIDDVEVESFLITYMNATPHYTIDDILSVLEEKYKNIKIIDLHDTYNIEY